MSTEGIREKLRHSLGENRYQDFLRDFVRVARKRGRLMFWLEEALDDAGLSITYQECLTTFTLCHVHMVPLVPHSVPVIQDVTDIRYSDGYDHTMALRFPYARQFVLANESLASAATTEVDHRWCPNSHSQYPQPRSSLAVHLPRWTPQDL